MASEMLASSCRVDVLEVRDHAFGNLRMRESKCGRSKLGRLKKPGEKDAFDDARILAALFRVNILARLAEMIIGESRMKHDVLEPFDRKRQVHVADVDVVVRRAGGGDAIPGPAPPLDSPFELRLRLLLGALEEHVLEQMGHPAVEWLLVAKAHLCNRAYLDGLRIAALLDPHFEAVRQSVPLDVEHLIARGGNGGCGRLRSSGHDSQQERDEHHSRRSTLASGERTAGSSSLACCRSGIKRTSSGPCSDPVIAWRSGMKRFLPFNPVAVLRRSTIAL